MPLTNVLIWPVTTVNIVANLPLRIDDEDIEEDSAEQDLPAAVIDDD